MADLVIFDFPHFPEIDQPQPFVSHGSQVVDHHTIAWEWTATTPDFFDRIRVQLYDSKFHDELTQKMQFSIYLGGVVIYERWALSSAPRFAWDTSAEALYDNPDPDIGAGAQGGYQLFQATYAQGGSPWSH